MVSSYYAIGNLFNKVSLLHPNIQSFTMGDISDIDLKKHTQYPLAHLMVNSVTIAEGKMEYDLTYFVLDKPVDIIPESSGSLNNFTYDYLGITNESDIFNTTLESINDVFSYIKRNTDNMDYEILEDAICTPFKDRFDNLVCGFSADLTVSVGNQNNICVI